MRSTKNKEPKTVGKIKLDSLSITDLNEYMKAAQIVCSRYDKMAQMNVGVYPKAMTDEMHKATTALKEFQTKYNDIISEMEKRLNNLE